MTYLNADRYISIILFVNRKVMDFIMSFSSDIKDKLSISEQMCENCMTPFVMGVIGFGAEIRQDCVRFNTENAVAAATIEKYLSEKFCVKCKIEKIHGYRISVFEEREKLIETAAVAAYSDSKSLMEKYMNSECCRSAFAKGAFISGGSVSDPMKSYHVEFDTRYSEFAELLKNVFASFGAATRIMCRKGHYIVYAKEYESVATILGVIGAGAAVLKLYNIQIEKEIRNEINRLVNFETANVNKITKAASRQIQAINILKKSGALKKLPPVLCEIAELRIKYPDESLKQLGERLNPPIGKSGVNHRLNRIIQIAEE